MQVWKLKKYHYEWNFVKPLMGSGSVEFVKKNSSFQFFSKSKLSKAVFSRSQEI